jgi:hypothetical protein
MKNKLCLKRQKMPRASKTRVVIAAMAAILIMPNVGMAEAPVASRRRHSAPLPPETNINRPVDEIAIRTTATSRRKRRYPHSAPEGKSMVSSPCSDRTRLASRDGHYRQGKCTRSGERRVRDSLVFRRVLQRHSAQVLQMPAAGPGSVVIYEYVQKRRPRILQDTWVVQGEIPVQRQYTLHLPQGWAKLHLAESRCGSAA